MGNTTYKELVFASEGRRLLYRRAFCVTVTDRPTGLILSRSVEAPEGRRRSIQIRRAWHRWKATILSFPTAPVSSRSDRYSSRYGPSKSHGRFRRVASRPPPSPAGWAGWGPGCDPTKFAVRLQWAVSQRISLGSRRVGGKRSLKHFRDRLQTTGAYPTLVRRICK